MINRTERVSPWLYHCSSLPSHGITQLSLLEAVISAHICTQSIMKKWFFERETAFISILLLMETFSRDWGFVFKIFSCKHGKVFVSVFQRLTWVSFRQCHLRLNVLSLVHSWRQCWSSWSHCDCSWWPRKWPTMIGANRHAAVVLIKH